MKVKIIEIIRILAYRSNNNQPYYLPAVKKAEFRLVDNPQMNHEYLPSHGHPSFIKSAVEYLLGENSPAVLENRAHGIQTLSGSGALYLGALFLSHIMNRKRIYLSNPTWGKFFYYFIYFNTQMHAFFQLLLIDFKSIFFWGIT